MVGQTISHYKITDKLGEGGMGVVYRADDTKLRRTVALKFLSRETLGNEEVAARLIREAQASASLDHPNICAVYGIHEEADQTFIAMAFIDGLSLAEKIKERPLPLDEALVITAQIAEGLQAAHEKDIVHRDIKPHNVMLTAKGQVKIMDFGLASLSGRTRLTKSGTTLGTPAYMAPEQLERKDADRRSDIWALGCVLYEALVQRTPFDADHEQAVAYGILNEDPEPVTALRSGLPTEIDRIIGKALAKDPAERYQHADDLLVDLRALQKRLGAKNASSGQHSAARPAAATPVIPQQKGTRVLQGAVAVLAVALLGVTAMYFRQTVPEAPTRRFSFVPPGDVNTNEGDASLALSPDGMHIAFTTSDGSSGLWVQDLDQDEPRQVAGTEGAYLPFWSPDSAFIAYAAGGELRKVSVQGGASGLICPLPSNAFLEGTWSPDGGSIVFSSYVGGEASLYKTSPQGGSPEQLITASEFDKAAPFASRPRFVSGAAGQILVFAVGTPAAAEMYVKKLDTGQTAALGPGDHPVYSATTGHLIYQSARNVYDLWARSFSPETLQFSGSAFPLRQNSRQPSVSDDGTLAFLDGSAAGAQTLAWFGRTGELLEAVGQPLPDILQPALSPDGRRVAVRSSESGNIDIWVHDLTRSTKTRFTFENQAEANPAWSPSGREIVYQSGGPPYCIMRRAADGTGEAVALVKSDVGVFYPDWSRDGRYLVYYELNTETQRDIRYVELRNDGAAGEPVTFLASPANEQRGKFSPDGRFLAYMSDESGRNEIYVRPFPGGEGKWQASINGGERPRWRSDGKELYYVEGSTLMAVSVSTESIFTLGRPQRLFKSPGLSLTGTGDGFRGYDVSADGQRFLTVAPVARADAAPPKIRFVENWFGEFRNRE